MIHARTEKIKQLLVGSEGLSVRIYIEWRRGAPQTWSLLKEQSNIYGKYVWEDGYQSLCIWDISVCSTQIWCFLSLQRKLEWRLNSSLFRHHLFVKSVYVAFCHILLLSPQPSLETFLWYLEISDVVVVFKIVVLMIGSFRLFSIKIPRQHLADCLFTVSLCNSAYLIYNIH